MHANDISIQSRYTDSQKCRNSISSYRPVLQRDQRRSHPIHCHNRVVLPWLQLVISRRCFMHHNNSRHTASLIILHSNVEQPSKSRNTLQFSSGQARGVCCSKVKPEQRRACKAGTYVEKQICAPRPYLLHLPSNCYNRDWPPGVKQKEKKHTLGNE